jgi:hypothetical protein
VDLKDNHNSSRRWRLPWWSRLPGTAAILVGIVVACSTPLYEPLDHDTDLAGAYALAFEAACDIDCGSGRLVYLVVSPTDPAITEAIVESTPAVVLTAISPIAVRDGLRDDVPATVFTVESAVLADDVAVIRVGHSEVTAEISTYIGSDYLVSLSKQGRWTLRTSEDTGITTTTSIS